MANLVCWHCGASLETIPEPFSRLAQCKACRADLHVCRLCRFYDPHHSDHCQHEMAEPAREIDVANFCHYFRPQPNAFSMDMKSKSDDALSQLKALFGENETACPESTTTPSVTQQNDTTQQETLSDYEQAKQKFDDLFK